MAVFNNILAGAAGSAGGAAGFQIERSLRFNSADSAYLNRTPSSAGNRKTWTWSGWVKRANSDSDHHLFVGDKAPSDSLSDTTFGRFYILSTGQLDLSGYTTAYRRTNALLRDPSAWYHLVVAVDTTQSTADDRIKLYINGSQVSNTDFATKNNPSLNADLAFNQATPHTIGARSRSGTIAHYHDGYLAEIHFVDGQALAPTDFGEYDDNNVWQPKTYSGTYGTNGFHLDFSDNSSKDALGTDSSGNNNDWDVTNLTASATKWSSYLIPQSPATFDSSYPASEAFDGSIAANQEARLNAGSYADRYIDFIPTGGIAFSSQIEMYVGASNFEYSYNGGSNVAVTAGAWHTVASGGGTLTSIRIQRTQTLTHTWRALRVDGTILVDGDPAGTDSLIDTPTNYDDGTNVGGNYCVMNPLDMRSNVATQNGNMEVSNATAGWSGIRGTIGVSSGKWYYELQTETASIFAGIATAGVDIYANAPQDSTSVLDDGALIYCDDGKYLLDQGGSANRQTYGTALANGDILGVAFDLDGNTVQFYKNGSALGSINISSSPLASNTVFPYYISYYNSTSTYFNFGQRPFAYTPPTGYKSLCTTNLPDPTIADGSTAFDVSTWTGTTANQSITGLNFSPDLVWIKARGPYALNHTLLDTVRGSTKSLASNTTAAESTVSYFNSFDSDGFTLNGGNQPVNGLNETHVGWAWDAGSSTVSNTDGSITSQVRANTSAGFSIVTWTGNSGTVGHGLNAVPSLIISKIRNTSSVWPVQHSYDTSQFLTLNTTDAASSDTTRFGAAPTSSVFSVGSWWNSDSDGVAYVFSPVEGYSAFGAYDGNGNADGPFIYTGFKVAYLIIKCISHTSMWSCWDTTRDVDNPSEHRQKLDEGIAEESGDANLYIDLLSNGFKPRVTDTDTNGSGRQYAYIAFAENPFKYARAR